MEEIKELEEVKTKLVTPLGDFNCQSFPIDECNKYAITDEELEALGKHQLKWSYEADTTIEEDVFEEVINEDTKEVEKVKKGTIQKTIKHPILVAYDNSKEVEKANARKEIAELKQLLKDTDFKAIKYFEGYYTDEEYEPIKLERQSYRDKINALEVLLNEE
jgi:hypothetical protein